MRNPFAAALALMVVLLTGCHQATSALPQQSSSASPTTSAVRSVGPTATGCGKPCEDSEPPVRRTAGAPTQLLIPAIGVNATIVDVGLNPDGSMQTPPYDANRAGWYAKGPRPGDPGPAVIVAHVDSKNGQDVFWRLHELEAGDVITVADEDSRRYRFTVEGAERVDKDELPYGRIWQRTSERRLTLITCTGPYDNDAGEYRDNLIVYAGAAV